MHAPVYGSLLGPPSDRNGAGARSFPAVDSMETPLRPLDKVATILRPIIRRDRATQKFVEREVTGDWSGIAGKLPGVPKKTPSNPCSTERPRFRVI